MATHLPAKVDIIAGELPPPTTLNLMELTSFISHCKIGKLNHYAGYEKTINWPTFLDDAVATMRRNKQQFYIKDDLFALNAGTALQPQERDPDFLNVKPF